MASSPSKPTVVISSSHTKPKDYDYDYDDDDDVSPEESSWTFYMQDFECGGGGDNINTSFSSGLFETSNDNIYNNNDNSSLISDAASSAARNFAGISNKVQAAVPTFALERSNNNVKKLSFKRPREATAAVNHDLDLEDTASSPVNSPKLTLKKNERNHNNQVLASPVVHANNSGHNHNLDYCSELKRKGFCLVPVSTLAKYFG